MEHIQTKATDQNIEKYLKVLKELKMILDNTPHVSMLKFSENHNVTKNLSTVLQKGGIIKLLKKGRYTEWEWVSIEPNKHMAIKTLQELSKLNPPRKNKSKEQKKLFDQPKKMNKQKLEYYEMKILFGLITFKIKPHFAKV